MRMYPIICETLCKVLKKPRVEMEVQGYKGHTGEINAPGSDN